MPISSYNMFLCAFSYMLYISSVFYMNAYTCVYLCVDMYMGCVCMHTNVYVPMYIRLVFMYIHAHVCICICMHMHSPVMHVHAWICQCMYICVYAYTCACDDCACMHMYMFRSVYSVCTKEQKC